MWGLSQPSLISLLKFSPRWRICVERGKESCHDDASFNELIWNNYHWWRWKTVAPECKNTCFCLSLWSMLCVWLWIIGDSIRASGMSGQSSLCLFIWINPWIIIVSTFSPFLCNLMDLFAADVQVKIKKSKNAFDTLSLYSKPVCTLKHTPVMLSHSSAKSPRDWIQYTGLK